MMRQEHDVDKELVSALADGQLQGAEFVQAVELIGASEEARFSWHAYHLAGDALRCTDLAPDCDGLAFVERLRYRLASDGPAWHAAMSGTAAAVQAPSYDAVVMAGHARHSANDLNGRWKLLAGMATVVAVAVVGWHFASGGLTMDRLTLLAAPPRAIEATGEAAVSAGTSGVAEAPVMLRDPRLDELLAAHKQFGGTSALQMPSGFLRNATFENTGR